jgi:hypothetical protein
MHVKLEVNSPVVSARMMAILPFCATYIPPVVAAARKYGADSAALVPKPTVCALPPFPIIDVEDPMMKNTGNEYKLKTCQLQGSRLTRRSNHNYAATTVGYKHLAHCIHRYSNRTI